MTLFVGQRVTLLKIDECLAMTHRYELEIRKALEPEAVGCEKRHTRLAVIRQRGKRKEFFLDIAADDILLDDWNLPFRTDTECKGGLGGKCLLQPGRRSGSYPSGDRDKGRYPGH